jgi:hypothetical protein
VEHPAWWSQNPTIDKIRPNAETGGLPPSQVVTLGCLSDSLPALVSYSNAVASAPRRLGKGESESKGEPRRLIYTGVGEYNIGQLYMGASEYNIRRLLYIGDGESELGRLLLLLLLAIVIGGWE